MTLNFEVHSSTFERSLLIARWRQLSISPWMRPFTEWRVCRKWIAQGRPIPAPPIVKQHIVKQMRARRAGAGVVAIGGVLLPRVIRSLDRPPLFWLRARPTARVEVADDIIRWTC